MQDKWAKLLDFMTNPIGVGTITLSMLLSLSAAFFWWAKITIAPPGPAIVAVELAIVALITGLTLGLVVNHLHNQIKNLTNERDNLQVESNKLRRKQSDLVQERDNLQVQISDLTQKLNEAQQRPEIPGRLPEIKGLELLVERWKTFKPKEVDKDILNQQISIALSIAQLAYSNLDKIRFSKYFSGAKIKSGAFLLEASTQKPLVLKFDSIENIVREQESYKHCVKQYLTSTAGEPIWLKQRQGRINSQDWGAIAYGLIGGEGVDADNLRQLQTFAEYYYKDHTDTQIDTALKKIFEVLKPWWATNRGWPADCRQGGPKSLYDEYARLVVKEQKIAAGVQEVGQELEIEALKTLKGSINTHVDLGEGIILPNPLYWVAHTFKRKHLGNWVNENRRNSIIHGDFHAGNILVTTDNQGDIIQPWVIDFPHAHVGPTVRDIARLEADLKVSLLSDNRLEALDINGICCFEATLLPKSDQATPPLVTLKPSQLLANHQIDPYLQKTWKAVCLLRDEARKYMEGDNAKPYYLALLHATLPILYYGDRSSWQKLYAFISAALLCERLAE